MEEDKKTNRQKGRKIGRRKEKGLNKHPDDLPSTTKIEKVEMGKGGLGVVDCPTQLTTRQIPVKNMKEHSREFC